MGAKKTTQLRLIKGYTFLAIWAILILAGVWAKRKLGMADLVVFFHLPAAVFLVLSLYVLSEPFRSAREKHELRHK